MITYFIMQVLPYIAVTVFIIGLLYRLGRWANARIVHNITLTPAPTSEAGALVDIVKEVTFFRSLFIGDRVLWTAAWIMHISLFFILAGHVLGIGLLGKQFAYLGLTSEETSELLSVLMGTFFGVVLLLSLFYLLYRRIKINEVRIISSPSDYLLLLLLIGIVLAGNLMRFVPQWGIHYEPVRDYVWRLISFSPITSNMEVMHSPVLIIHVFLVQLLMLVFPFSKLLHSFGMFAHRYIINRPYVEPTPGLLGEDREPK